MTMPYGGQGEGGTGFDGGGQGGQPNGQNPAWNDLLNDIPQELHAKVTPHLQKWDQNFQNVQSSLAPYKEFVDNRVDPEYLKVAIGLANALEEQPELIYQALQEQFGGQQGPPNGNGTGNGQGQPGNDGGGQGELENEFDGLPPEIQQQLQMIPQLQQQVEMLGQIAAQRNQQELDAQEDAELDQLYQRISSESEVFKALNGEDRMAEPYINSLLMAGYDEKEAMEIFSNFVDRVKQYNNRPQPPTLLGTGGFMPERQPKPRDLSEQQTKDLIANYVRQAYNQGS